MPREREAGEGGLFKVKIKGRECPNWYIKVGGRRYATGTPVKQVAIGMLQDKLGQHAKGTLPAQEPGKLRYEAMRDALLAEYKTQVHNSLQELSDGTVTIWGLNHLNKFFAHKKAVS